MDPDVIDYRQPSAITALDGTQLDLLADIPTAPVEICKLVQGLVIEPGEAAELGFPEERDDEGNIRGAADLIDVLVKLDPAPLHEPRKPEHRVLGTCRHFAVLSCALMRFRGIPARARCGFGTYFVPGKNIDHWVTEYWVEDEARWVRVDAEALGDQLVARPDDLADGEFLSGGEAWALYRKGDMKAEDFGVDGVEDAWGVAEIRNNVVRDLAALNKTEMLPWDAWGRMDDSYDGRTGEDYDELMDTVAAVCASGDGAAIQELYTRPELTVPASLVR
jgi:hypothetical protein